MSAAAARSGRLQNRETREFTAPVPRRHCRLARDKVRIESVGSPDQLSSAFGFLFLVLFFNRTVVANILSRDRARIDEKTIIAGEREGWAVG